MSRQEYYESRCVVLSYILVWMKMNICIINVYVYDTSMRVYMCVCACTYVTFIASFKIRY